MKRKSLNEDIYNIKKIKLEEYNEILFNNLNEENKLKRKRNNEEEEEKKEKKENKKREIVMNELLKELEEIRNKRKSNSYNISNNKKFPSYCELVKWINKE